MEITLQYEKGRTIMQKGKKKLLSLPQKEKEIRKKEKAKYCRIKHSKFGKLMIIKRGNASHIILRNDLKKEKI